MKLMKTIKEEKKKVVEFKKSDLNIRGGEFTYGARNHRNGDDHAGADI